MYHTTRRNDDMNDNDTRARRLAVAGLLHDLKQYGMAPLYATLLGLARSRAHLRHLHDEVLLANQRLLRTDFIKLEQGWAEFLFGGNPDSAGDLPKDEYAALLLMTAAEDSRPWGYYRGAINAGRERCDHYGGCRHHGLARILSVPERSGMGYTHFRSIVGGVPVELQLYADEAQNRVIARFVTWERPLDEPTTFRLIQSLPNSTFDEDFSSSQYGTQINFCYVLSVAGLGGLLNHQNEGPRGFLLMATDTLLEAVRRKLLARGIRLEGGITRIVP